MGENFGVIGYVPLSDDVSVGYHAAILGNGNWLNSPVPDDTPVGWSIIG